jgi:glutamyl-Q tRNA(Asp) synthetase
VTSVFRFAPSPNGHLHAGHAYSALLNAELARRAGGRFLLRIEDIDVVRCPPRLAADLLEDLAWLGLRWEEPVRRQSAHFADYRAALDRLAARGLLYPSLASRKEAAAAIASHEAARGAQWGGGWPRDPDGAPHHPRALLPDDADPARLAAGEPRALRLDMARALALAPPLFFTEEGRGRLAAEPGRWGDVVLARKEFPASYHIAVVVDDALQGVTHVVRGADLFEATGLHRLLQHLLGLPEPVYRHHPLIRGEAGEKLSKSLASKSLRQLRQEGLSAGELRHALGFGSSGAMAGG